FDNVSQTSDVPARAILAKRVKSMPGLAHHTAQDVCSWFATACKRQRRKERADSLVRARNLPPPRGVGEGEPGAGEERYRCRF
ncbi:hypothetical protein BD309DRAFT_877224, partial [Dichomitus squalens]